MKILCAFICFLTLILGGGSTVFAAETLPIDKQGNSGAVIPKNVVNINTANAQELTKLKGVGEKKAEAIIAWRTENGNFKSVEDLLEVKGIGEATLEANRDIISI